MLLRVAALVAALPLLYSATAPAQGNEHSPEVLVARLSYHSTYAVDWREQQNSPRICFALYRSGYYRILRLTQDGIKTLQGTLSRDELARLVGMLEHLDSETSRGGIIRQGSESFRAEIVREGETTEFAWVDPDHERPFPDSATKIIKWLQNFRDPDATRLTLRELSEQPICPPASVRELQPVVATLEPMSGGVCEQQRTSIGVSSR